MKQISAYLSILLSAMLFFAGCSAHKSGMELSIPAEASRPAPIQVQPLSTQSYAGYTLVEKAYSIAELEQMDVSCVKVNALSENVVVTCGGDTLKFSYYQQSDNDYEITTSKLHNKTKTYLTLMRQAKEHDRGPARTIQVTLPADFEFYRLYAGVENGSVLFEGCSSSLFYANSAGGNIAFHNCTALQKLTTETHSGRIDIVNLTTGNNFDSYILSESSPVQFTPADQADNYRYIFGTRSTNTILINGKSYPGGSFEVNPSAIKTVRIESGYFFDDDALTGRTGQGTATFTIKDKNQDGDDQNQR